LWQLKPEIATKVEALLRSGAPISRFTHPGPSYLVEHKTFTRFRIENPHINDLVLINRVGAIARGQTLRRLSDQTKPPPADPLAKTTLTEGEVSRIRLRYSMAKMTRTVTLSTHQTYAGIPPGNGAALFTLLASAGLFDEEL
jgi:hypothetical protein